MIDEIQQSETWRTVHLICLKLDGVDDKRVEAAISDQSSKIELRDELIEAVKIHLIIEILTLEGTKVHK